MNRQIYPCLWFDGTGEEAARFYCEIFDDAAILRNTPLVTTFEAENTKFMTLNGGPHFRVNPAVSYYVYCGNEEKLLRLYEALKEGGSILMPLDQYPWSNRYAWVSDRFGVNWQLDINATGPDQKIVPVLLFANEKMGRVKEAQRHYTGLFPGSSVLLEAPYPEEENLPAGTLLFTQFELKGFMVNAMSSSRKHDFDFTEGNSFVVECRDQEEIDYYWDKLTEGGSESMCGWLKDRFGVSWQIVPSALDRLLNHPENGPAVMQALMKMKKIDIQVLETAR